MGSAELEVVERTLTDSERLLAQAVGIMEAQTSEVRELLDLHKELLSRSKIIIEEIERRGVSELMSEVMGSMFKRRKRRGNSDE